MKRLWILSLVLCVHQSTVLQTTQPSKDELRRIALKQSRHWERQLAVQGMHSLSQKTDTHWGIRTLDSTYQQAVTSGHLQNVHADAFKNLQSSPNASVSVSAKPITMMDMSNLLYDFMGKHGILVKAQSDNASHIRYKLYQRKNLGAEFNVKLAENKKNKSVVFSSKSPYLKKSLTLAQGQTLGQQMMPFLDRTYKTWRKFSSRLLKEVPSTPAVTAAPIQSPADSSLKPSLSALAEEAKQMKQALTREAPTLTPTSAPRVENRAQVKHEAKATAKATRKATTKSHFVDALDNIGQGGRKLIETGEIKASLEDALDDRLDLVEEDSNQWVVSLKAKDGGSSDRICQIVVENDENGHMVSMNNKDIDFLRHFQKVISKALTSSDSADDLTEFFKEQLAEFVGLYVTVLGKQMGVRAMGDFIKEEIFAPKGIQLQENVTSQSGPESADAVFIVLDSIDADSEQIVTQVRVYKINRMYNQVQISHREREVELQVPRQMDDSQKHQLKTEVSEILSDDIINNTVGYRESLDILEDLLKSNLGCSDLSMREEQGNTTVIEVSDESNCAFFGMSFLITGFDYEYLQYMHLLLDNQYFQAEHLIAFTLEGDFKANLQGVLTDMASNIQSVQKSGGQQDEGDLTLDNLTEAIEQVLGTEVQRENLNEKEIVYKRDNDRGRSVTVVRILVVPGDGEANDLYRVFLFDPSGHKKGFHSNKSQHEYMMYASNGQQELKIFMTDLTKWKAKLDHRKLEKI